MTAPTPREQVAEVLAAHGEQHIATVDSDLWCVTCDRIIGSAEGDDAETDRVIAAHQAEMLVAAGLLPDREEWGVEEKTYVGGDYDRPAREMSEHAAHEVVRIADINRARGYVTGEPRIVHRYVTEWRTA